jgi:hypothetical protein
MSLSSADAERRLHTSPSVCCSPPSPRAATVPHLVIPRPASAPEWRAAPPDRTFLRALPKHTLLADERAARNVALARAEAALKLADTEVYGHQSSIDKMEARVRTLRDQVREAVQAQRRQAANFAQQKEKMVQRHEKLLLEREETIDELRVRVVQEAAEAWDQVRVRDETIRILKTRALEQQEQFAADQAEVRVTGAHGARTPPTPRHAATIPQLHHAPAEHGAAFVERCTGRGHH